ncbi:MAG: anaerobic ribonucleoside-triphosphate reductase activating protein [Gorillibacterium sp.]|nr:anaerobic ribonucleoside-triphosphate reductase activating protein [Gorillibacterium sp.]
MIAAPVVDAATSSLLRIAGLVEDSIVDGPGLRLTVFAQGCLHNCLGCHNIHTHSNSGGTLISIKSIINRIQANPLLDGVTLSGGEPFEQAESFVVLAKRVQALGLNVITYTGYTYERLVAGGANRPGWQMLLDQTDYLVDGRFVLEKRNLMLKYRGSENQRIIDLNRTRLEKAIIIANL